MVAQALPSRSQCSYNVRETPREMCTTVDMVSFQVDIVDTLDILDIYIIPLQEVCEEVPRMVPEVTCDTRMKEIELKEICVDIDLQLPRSGAGVYLQYLEYLHREECTTEEKEQCRFEPREVILQKCDPTVKEVCQDKMKPVCTEKCENI